jgi:hypothetical protein
MNGKKISIMRKINLVLVLLIIFSTVYGQRKRCGVDEVYHNRFLNNPALKQEHLKLEEQFQLNSNVTSRKRTKITIPVVVHVIYNADIENISDEQIQTQILSLNQDYNKLNKDTLGNDHAFYSLVGNPQIAFELASIDPNGKATNGITRTKTTKVDWGNDDLNNDNMKFSSSGGIENWNPKKYLNIYTVRFADTVGLLGYAYFPEDLASYPETDGAVIDFRCFGLNGSAGIEGFSAYKLGRTVTHEVGHWLGLRHIWGDLVYATDKKCGDDLVADTPAAESDNSGVPTFPHRANNHCGSDANGEMYMNFMDYVNDEAMVMFSKGQATRMMSSINTYRKDLLSYQSTANIDEVNLLSISFFPNPCFDKLTIVNEKNQQFSLKIIDLVGRINLEIKIEQPVYELALSSLLNGNYIIEFSDEHTISRYKLTKQ